MYALIVPESSVTMERRGAESRRYLGLNDYQSQALKADRRPDASLTFPLLGLFGETGTLLSVVKKKQRDAASYLGYAPHVTEEFGDVLWYFAVVAQRGGLLLSDVASDVRRTVEAQHANDTGDILFRGGLSRCPRVLDPAHPAPQASLSQ